MTTTATTAQRFLLSGLGPERPMQYGLIVYVPANDCTCIYQVSEYLKNDLPDETDTYDAGGDSDWEDVSWKELLHKGVKKNED